MGCYRRIAAPLLLLSLAVVGVHLIYAEFEDRFISILCVDSIGEPIANATVTIGREGEILYTGITNSSGFLPEAIPKGIYYIEVEWRNRTVYSGIVSAQDYGIVKIPCEVYTLSIFVNYLGIIPIVNARISITDVEYGWIVYSVDKLRVPYGFYAFSAETSIKLPKGGYEVVVESLNSERKEVFLVDNSIIRCTNVISLDSILFIALLISTIISLILFILTSRR
ncbi:MAG: carboxypeptidase-like regulatory domain-containing protein [Candidatus Bathyarchaeia archaeon]